MMSPTKQHLNALRGSPARSPRHTPVASVPPARPPLLPTPLPVPAPPHPRPPALLHPTCWSTALGSSLASMACFSLSSTLHRSSRPSLSRCMRSASDRLSSMRLWDDGGAEPGANAASRKVLQAYATPAFELLLHTEPRPPRQPTPGHPGTPPASHLYASLSRASHSASFLASRSSRQRTEPWASSACGK